MITKLLKGIAPAAALAMGAMVTGCGGMNITINDEDGVPLSELDLSGAAPDELVLASPDSVVITQGDALTINVEGDDDVTEAMRFTLDEDTIGIMRKPDFDGDGRVATVRVTMPGPKSLVMAGSGNIAAQTMAEQSDITIAGSGRIDVASLSASKLDLNVMGSGQVGAAGTLSNLELNIAGSGQAQLDELTIETADITIAGSGSGAFASDGEVDATIMGSGNVTVYGRATCSVNAMGSGKLTCKPAEPEAETDQEAGDE
ncbi:head GIN domain-containing protein [Erythrobacter sp. W53]|uniref:head GIN domain-containing protein n=1 Tax=Erythrobacter sp. W53 TaxID=3425947 RepID=UPI003D76862F